MSGYDKNTKINRRKIGVALIYGTSVVHHMVSALVLLETAATHESSRADQIKVP